MGQATHCGEPGPGRDFLHAAPGARSPSLHRPRGLARVAALDRVEPLGLRTLHEAEPAVRVPADLEEDALLGSPPAALGRCVSPGADRALYRGAAALSLVELQRWRCPALPSSQGG